MVTKKTHVWALIPFIGLLVSACKKIDVPEQGLAQLFKEWKYVSSSGGYSGVQSNTAFGSDSWVSYDSHGKYVRYGSNKKVRDNFSFQKHHSINSGKEDYIIVYEDGLAQSFICRNDSLFLFDEAYDAFSYVFVKR
jgi:hypothetical protein